MKIVHICTTSEFSEIYAYQENLLSHYHRMLGHDVTVIASIYSRVGYEVTEPVGERYLSEGVKLIRLAPLFKNKTLDIHLQMVKGLKKAILKEQPDLLFVHAVGCLSYKCFPGIKKKLPNLKIVFDNHADLINSLHSPITKFLHRVIYRYALVPSLVKIADWFYGVTPSRCDFLRDVYGIHENKIKLLVMGADDEKMDLEHRVQLRRDVRENYEISEDDFLIVTGGKIDRLKNIHVLAHAVNAIGRKNVKLLVFGKINDDVKPLFDEEASDQLITIGWVDSDKVYKYFYAADLVVFPGLHSVLWEQAVASKVPCAFSKMDGFEHFNMNENCILMTGKDSKYYENLIKGLLDNPTKYEALKNNANNPQLEQFYYSHIAKQVLSDVGLE